MKTIYAIYGGGQFIRENLCLNRPKKVKIVRLQNDWVEKCGCDGQDFYTNTLWATDLETVIRWAEAWAKGYGTFKYEIV